MTTALVSTSVESAILTALVTLGPTPRVVAENLKVMGIRGRFSHLNCPIGNYLRMRVLPGTLAQKVTVSVGLTGIHLRDYFYSGVIYHRIDTPDVIGRFIGQFDRGAHWDLYGDNKGLEPQVAYDDDDL